ncbi:ATP-binding protein [Pseudonocardia sp. RS11V-5]|uniref:ATP-binding protein n=1 Tax=Pseudonocardia terrae TaxID=2905831 RepID=UPI001E62D985|nr:ATP-binding protein [Pseudonocardia terrae]MCE3554510.1 ATP-binding protein [Pseudonocardia terrae]
MEALNEVTLAELHDLVSNEIATGNESDQQEGRKRLLQAIEDCAAEAAEGNAAEVLLEARSWRIAEIRVAGIGGIASLDPPALKFAPVPGITVVRGLNGQGKTSLARSIDCALRGDGDLSIGTTNTLWAAELLTEGAAAGKVCLTLVSGASRLVIDVDFAERADTPTVVGSLTDAGESQRLELGSAWRRALDNARAHYSYDALQNQLVETKALQGFLEELLVLGPEWQRVRDMVESRAQCAIAAQKSFDSAVKKARTAEDQLAEQYDVPGSDLMRPAAVDWPRTRDVADIDTWLRDTGLSVADPQSVTMVADDHEERIASIRTRFQAAEERLATAEARIEGPGIAAALHHMDQLVAVEALDSAVCPLCGSSADWRGRLRQLTGGLQERAAAAKEVLEAVTELRDWIVAELAPLLDAAVPGGPDRETAAFRAATARGCQAHSDAHVAGRALLERLSSDVYRQWLDQLRAATDTSARWRSELATVVHEFAAAVRGNAADAADAVIWKKAQETLNDLQVAIRQRRQDAVTARLNDALARMLPDAAVELPAIQHQGGVKQQRGVKVDLMMGGRVATLGMLSSGQRNALLLTPLLVHDVPGPFGFLIVDDPVHALDDTRVDLLARELARLSETRQVIALTHDPRLEEHLRARNPDMTVIELQRDAATRTVSWTTHSLPWQSLLTDAREIRKLSTGADWTYSEDLHSVVAGLCRAAVDGALRQAVISCAVTRGEDVSASLATLGLKHATRDRIAHVTALAGGKARLPVLDRSRARHLKFWNKGAHGQLPPEADLDSTIAAAEAACQELAAHDWSSI